jgi:hypothetical protein
MRENVSSDVKLIDAMMNVPQTTIKKKSDTIARIFNKTKSENFISDWFAYLMRHNPEVLSALLSAADINLEDYEFNIEREHVFDDGRRIDFLLTNETSIIGIENKIDSGKQDNQLRDYSNSLNEENDGKDVYKIFLKPAYNGATATDGFVEVTYEALVEELRTIRMDFINDMRGAFLLLDFVTHIEENIIMANSGDFKFTEWTSYISKYQEQINDIMREAKTESINVNAFIKDQMLSVVNYSDEWKLGNDTDEPRYIQLFKPEWMSTKEIPFIHFELLRGDNNQLPTSFYIRLDIEGRKPLKKQLAKLLEIPNPLYELNKTMTINYSSEESFNNSIDVIMGALCEDIDEWVPKIEKVLSQISKS